MKVMKDVPSSFQHIITNVEAYETWKNNMNNHMTTSGHFYYIIMNKHEQYQIIFIPSA
jgi:hypothetical protein